MAFTESQRMAIEDISAQILELTAAIKRLSENKMPSVNDSSNVAKPKDA
jgi:hypothetical protein